jgi:hypothetical protein
VLVKRRKLSVRLTPETIPFREGEIRIGLVPFPRKRKDGTYKIGQDSTPYLVFPDNTAYAFNLLFEADLPLPWTDGTPITFGTPRNVARSKRIDMTAQCLIDARRSLKIRSKHAVESSDWVQGVMEEDYAANGASSDQVFSIRHSSGGGNTRFCLSALAPGFGLDTHAHTHHVSQRDDGSKAGIAFARKRFVQTFPTNANPARDLGHAQRTRNCSKRSRQVSRVMAGFVKTRLQIGNAIRIGFQIIRTVPRCQVHGLASTQCPSQCECTSNVFSLRRLVATTQQHNYLATALHEVDAIAGPHVETHLRNAFADRLHIAKSTKLQSIQPRLNSKRRVAIPQRTKPSLKNVSFDDLHACSVSQMLQIHNSIAPQQAIFQVAHSKHNPLHLTRKTLWHAA